MEITEFLKQDFTGITDYNTALVDEMQKLCFVDSAKRGLFSQRHLCRMLELVVKEMEIPPELMLDPLDHPYTFSETFLGREFCVFSPYYAPSHKDECLKLLRAKFSSVFRKAESRAQSCMGDSQKIRVLSKGLYNPEHTIGICIPEGVLHYYFLECLDGAYLSLASKSCSAEKRTKTLNTIFRIREYFDE